MSFLSSKLVVYTSIFGEGYKLPKVKPASGVDYICITNQHNLEANNWELAIIRSLLFADMARSSRDPKIRPHFFLNHYSRSLYIDPSVELLSNPIELWEHLIESDDVILGAMFHSFRDTLSSEFAAVSEQGLESEQILHEQYNLYQIYSPQALNLKPVWGGILARRHNKPDCIIAMERWFASVMRYSRRDQLSLPVVLDEIPSELLNLKKENIKNTRFHRWPIPGYARPKSYYESLATPNSSTLQPLHSTISSLNHMIKQEPNTKSISLPPKNNKVVSQTMNFDKEIDLFYFEDKNNQSRIYVSDKKRLNLYNKGIVPRLRWLLHDYRIPESLIQKGDWIIDIGANNGELGIWTEAVGGHYIGFEPDPNAFKALSHNVGSKYIFDVALSDTEGTANFYLATDEGDSSLFKPSKSNNQIQVRKQTLDSILTNSEFQHLEKVKLLKIEAEGMEPEVIAGAKQSLKRVDYIAVDAGPERGGENTVPEVLNELYKSGFIILSCFLTRGTFFLIRENAAKVC